MQSVFFSHQQITFLDDFLSFRMRFSGFHFLSTVQIIKRCGFVVYPTNGRPPRTNQVSRCAGSELWILSEDGLAKFKVSPQGREGTRTSVGSSGSGAALRKTAGVSPEALRANRSAFVLVAYAYTHMYAHISTYIYIQPVPADMRFRKKESGSGISCLRERAVHLSCQRAHGTLDNAQ